jgi:hypothetical protein
MLDNHNDLYGLLDPNANKFIVISKNFSAIKNLQFTIMQKFFFPVVNIGKTLGFQTECVRNTATAPDVTKNNCHMYGVNPAAIQSLEKTLPIYTHSHSISTIQESTTSIPLNSNLTLLLKTMLEVLEIVDAQLKALQEFKKSALKDRHNGIFEFKNFLKKLLDTKEQIKSLDEIFDQETNLFNTGIPEARFYQEFITRTLLQIFNNIDVTNRNSTHMFLQQLHEQLKVTPHNAHVIFYYFLKSNEFSEIECFQQNTTLWDNFTLQNTMPAQLLIYVSNKVQLVKP